MPVFLLILLLLVDIRDYFNGAGFLFNITFADVNPRLFQRCRFSLDITFADGKRDYFNGAGFLWILLLLMEIRDCFSWANTSVRPYGFSAFMVSFFCVSCRG